MTRIRCLPSHKDQAILFCQNNEIPFYKDKEYDLIFVSIKDVHEVSSFLLRLETLDKQETLLKEIGHSILS